MIDILMTRYPGAQRAYLAANSSSYFLRKLREDPDVHRVGAQYSTDDIVAAIKTAVGRAPQSLEELVVPYALLASLGIRGPRARLEEVAALDAPHHEWLQEIAARLAASWKTTILTSISVALPKVHTGTVKASSNTTSKLEIILPGRNQ
jgi:hypothetical protein